MDVATGALRTFLFTDVEGSTRLWEQSPEAMAEASRRHDAILRAAIEQAGGQVVKTMGDGVMAVFDATGPAVTAALDAQRTLAADAWPGTGPLRVRMGIHAGDADQRAGDYFGPAVNRTARLMAAGHGGQVLLSASAATSSQAALPPGASFLSLGEHRLKDLGRPEQVFQLVHPDLQPTFPPLATARPAWSRLPTPVGAVVRREAELSAIRARLEAPDVRLVTLVGPGGTGKTTLAVQVADDIGPRFRDGVAFVDLARSRDTDAVLASIARAVGLDETVERPIADELAERLRDQRMLMVIDNFEQVAQAAAAVADLLRACPGLVILATSREALHVRGERVVAIPPLELPPASLSTATASSAGSFEAIQLFVERARDARPDFNLTDDNASTVVEICRRLDGLPLAIELAAPRLRLFSLEDLRDRLGDRLGLLRSGPRDLPERQQTLRATMDWSFDLLEPGEQRLFELLAVFADADIAAVEAVAGMVEATATAGVDTLETLVGLIEKSLVRRIDRPTGEPGVSMLETMREFAAARLASEPAFEAEARRAHATWFADLATQWRADLTGEERDRALTALTADVGNLRNAWRHWVGAGDLEQLQRLVNSLLMLNDARGWYADTVTLTTDLLGALERTESTHERVGQEIALRTSLARALMATKGFTPEVEAAFSRAVDLFERGADLRQQFSVLRGLAALYQFQGRFDRAAQLGEELLALAEREQDPRMLIEANLVQGAVITFVADLQSGLHHLDRAIEIIEREPPYARALSVGNDSRVACYTSSAFALWLLGFPDRAVARMRSALDLAARLEHPATSAYARFHAGLLHLWRREPDVVVERATALTELAEEYDFRIWTAAGSCLLGAGQVGLGRLDEGLAKIDEGLARYEGLRSPPVFWPMLRYIDASAKLLAGRAAEALKSLEPAITMMDGASVQPELHLLKAAILGSSPELGGREAARPWYGRALDGATARGARMTMLRAATALVGAEPAAERAGSPASAATLRDILATFDEGFETRDLIEARAALEGAGADRPTIRP